MGYLTALRYDDVILILRVTCNMMWIITREIWCPFTQHLHNLDPQNGITATQHACSLKIAYI